MLTWHLSSNTWHLKILALDVGTQRIGVAIGDDSIGVAASRTFVVNDENVWQEIGKLCTTEKIGKILVGHPRSMSGEISEQTKLCEDFAQQTEEKLHLPTQLVDERLTSREAHGNLAASMKAKEHKAHVDSEAARILLQMYFDGSQ